MGLYVYEAKVDDSIVYLRVNDFPDEPLYTVIYDDIDIVNINDFPKNWSRAKRNESG